MKLVDLTISDFTNELSSASPAPGGGSVAALSGALGTALSEMVSNLTLGKKKYSKAQPAMVEIKNQARAMAGKLLKLVDEDTLSYNRVVEAYKLPKDTSAEQQLRLDVIQDALKAAAHAPFQTLKHCATAMELVKDVIAHGNPNCITDAGMAAELINSAVRGAAYNVGINLLDIKDPGFVSQLRQKSVQILNSVQKETDTIRLTLEKAVNLE